MTGSIQHLLQARKFDAGIVTLLYTLDCSRIGEAVFHFTPGLINGAIIRYQGIDYQPFPIQMTGWELTSQGTQPRPKVAVSNVGGRIVDVIARADSLVGSTLRRTRTFTKFLDNGDSPDPDAHWPVQSFIVDRKSQHNKMVVEWELANPLDARNIKIPGRTCLKNSCDNHYRQWVTNQDGSNGRFVYDTTPTRQICPYSDPSRFYTLNQAVTTDASKDACDKRLSSCRLRFGQRSTLPFTGFPGMRKL